MKPGDLVIVFNTYPGVVVRAAPTPGRATVSYQAPNGVRVRASIALEDIKVRDSKWTAPKEKTK